jgi:hypothetical protein
MLYKVIAGHDTFELNPELKAVEEFSVLTERQMTYVILASDYRTPFRKLPWPERRVQAAISSGYKMEKDGKRLDKNGRAVVDGKNDAVQKAIKRYNAVQKDEDYETLLGLSKLISDIRELNATTNKSLTELEKAVKFSKELPALMKAKKDLEDILEMREDEVTDIGVEKTPEEDLVLDNLSVLAQINEEDPDN